MVNFLKWHIRCKRHHKWSSFNSFDPKTNLDFFCIVSFLSFWIKHSTKKGFRLYVSIRCPSRVTMDFEGEKSLVPPLPRLPCNVVSGDHFDWQESPYCAILCHIVPYCAIMCHIVPQCVYNPQPTPSLSIQRKTELT